MKVIINLYKALLCFLSLFSTCKSKLPDTIIIVFPEIGIDGIEYDDVLPKNIHKLYLNTWTNDQFDKLKKIENILEYKTWYLGIISKTKLEISNALKKYNHKLPKTIFFAHSFGAQVADELKDHADVIITYGGEILIKPNFMKTYNLLGTQDEYILSNYLYWPKYAKPIESLNHYSCVSLEGKKKSLKWNYHLNKFVDTSLKKSEKTVYDKGYVIKREVTWLINY